MTGTGAHVFEKCGPRDLVEKDVGRASQYPRGQHVPLLGCLPLVHSLHYWERLGSVIGGQYSHSVA